MRKINVFAVLAFCPAIQSACSQSSFTVDVGLNAYHSYHGGDIDNVSLDTGNLTISIPILSYPQRGKSLKADFALIYNGTGRAYQQITCIQGRCTDGWIATSLQYYSMALTQASAAAGSPALFDLQDIVLAQKDVQIPGSNPASYWILSTVASADGGSHTLGQTTTGQVALDGSGYQTSTTFDASGNPTCHWDCSLPPLVGAASLLATHNGITYETGTGGTARIDADGNYIIKGSNSITDTVGRVIPISPLDSTVSSRCPTGTTKSISWTPPGYTQPYTFCYTTITLSTYGVPAWTHPTETVLETLVLPNSQSWSFQYNEQASGTGCSGSNVGDVTQITFPTGGTIAYTYTCITPYGTASQPYYTTAVASRTINANDGTGSHTWTYSYNITSSGVTTTITDPMGNATTNAMNASSMQRVETRYSGGTNGTVLRTITSNFLHSTATGYPIFPTSVSTQLENGQTTTTNNTYCCDFTFSQSEPSGSRWYPSAASYGKATDNKVYDYSGSLLKETAASYLFQSNSNYMNPGFFDLISQKTVYSGSGSEMSQTTYGFDETSRVTSGIASLSGAQMTTPIYSVYGHLTSETQWLNTGPSNPKSTVSYYDTGEVYQAADPLGHTTSTYFCTGSSPTTLPCSQSTYLGALPTVVANALNQQTSYTYRTDTGQVLTVKDPNGQTITDTYNDPGDMNRLTGISNPDGGLMSIQYNDTGEIGVTVTQKVSSSLNKVSQAIVDGLGRESETILLSDPAGATYTFMTYDQLGRKYQAWNPTRCSSPSNNCQSETTWGVTTYQYDALSREVLEIPPDGSATSDNITTSYSGNTTTVTDEAGNHRTSTLDALGRLTQVSEGSAGYITIYTYDALNNLTCVEQHGGVSGTGCSSSPANDSTSQWRVRRFTYDSLSRLLTAKNPETGTITYGYNTDSVVTSKTDNRGISITYTPDALHRLTQKSYSDSESAITYTYDAFTSGTNYGIGRRTGMIDASGSSSWTYDTMGREWSESRTTASVTKGHSTLYYFDGSSQQITYPAESASQGGHSVVLSVVFNGSGSNTAGEVLSVTDTTNNITYANSLAYAPTGQMLAGTFGHSSSYSGITQSNSFNSRGQPISLTACGTSSCTGAGYLLDLSYNYGLGTNDNGNVQSITNGKSSGRNQAFQYTDGLNRLTQATSGTTWGVSFSYDPWGNLIQTNPVSGTGSNPMSLSQVVTQSNGGSSNQFQLMGYGYDAAGNVLNDGSGNRSCSGAAAYSWNAEEQIACAYGSTYSYDGDGARVEKNGGSATPTLYWGGLVESDLSGNVTTEYIFIGGRRIARRDVATGNVYYYFEDMLGSSNVVANSLGGLVNESDFYPFGGESVIVQNLSNQKFKFTGKERDTESGNDYFGARYYASTMGRWMSPDFNGTDDYASPIPYADLSNPQTLNLYSYGGNNPLSNVDPDGHEVWLCATGASTCTHFNDDQWAAFLKTQAAATSNGTNGGITISGNGFMGTGSVMCGGTECGTATYHQEGLQDASGDILVGIAGGKAADFVLGRVAGPVMDFVGGLFGRGAADAAGDAAGSAAVDVANLSAKIVKQMGTRGWTKDEIIKTVEGGTQHTVVNKATGGTATEFVNPANGKFVVVDNATKQVLQVSGPGFKPNHLMNP
jgi:RHS repeat-associated protein